MNKTHIIEIGSGILLAITVAIAGYMLTLKNPVPAPIAVPTSIEYRNDAYGFKVALPLSWKGYSVSIDKWTGYPIGDQLGEVGYASGPVVSIHNPKWTAAVPYQDIPIMVFTLDQWNLLQEEKFSVSAAPIGPSELGRNGKYVFGLPPRYNYAFPLGYEEVDQILQSKPLTTF